MATLDRARPRKGSHLDAAISVRRQRVLLEKWVRNADGFERLELLGGVGKLGFPCVDTYARDWVQLTRQVVRVDEGAIRLMGALGESTRSAAIEGLLAEGLTTLMSRAELAPDLVNAIAGR